MSARPTPEAVLDVRVISRSTRTAVDGRRGSAVLIRLAAPPVDGAANDALVGYLAEVVGVPRRAVRVVAGEKSRDKRVAIAGVDLPAVLSALNVA